MRTVTPAHLRWLKANKHDLAPLTGQDHRALAAIAECWELYCHSDANGQEGALRAVRALLPGLQEKCWPLARELIARSLDWGDRERLWSKVEPSGADVTRSPERGTCSVCGCTEDRACVGGCFWRDEAETLCSACYVPPVVAVKKKAAKAKVAP